MYDITSNHKICNMRTHADQTASSADQLTIDLQEAVTGHLGLRERTSRGLLIILVTSVGTGGTLDIVIKDSPDNSTFDADFCTIDQIDATGIYICDVQGINRYAKLYTTAATDTVTWSAILVGFDPERCPVQQSDTTEIGTTYGSGR